MLSAYCLALFVFLLPVGLAFFLFYQNIYNSALRWPLLVGLHLLLLGALASLFQSTPYDARKLIGLSIVSAFGALWLIRVSPLRRSGLAGWQPWLLGLVILLPQIWILGHQGWEFDPYKLFKPGVSYLRGPFNTDGERNVILTEALLRREGSPFMAKGEFSYQLFWFYISALLSAPFSGLTRYSVVTGITLGLSTVFYALLVSVLSVCFPRVSRQKKFFSFLILALVWHADIIHLMGSWIKHGRPGMEADGSVEWVFFRNFSMELTTLLSPHHTLFFLFTALFFYSARVWRPGKAIFLGAAVLASPILSALTFPWFVAVYCYQRKKVTASGIAIGMGIFFLHQLIYRFPLWQHFTREVGSEIQILPLARLLQLGPAPWVGLPSLWMTSLGVGGLLATAVLIFQWRRGKVKVVDPIWLALFPGNLIVYYLVTGMELQRHYAIFSSFLVLLYVCREISRLKKIMVPRWVGAGFVLLVAFQVYFVYAFTAPPSLVSQMIPWRDYFMVNQLLREKFKGRSVLSAMPHENGGFPISMEAAAGFCMPYDSFVYTKLSPEQVALLMRANAEKRIAPFGLPLGYELILWGPVEDKAWGPQVKQRFIHPRSLLASVGEIGVYELRDLVREKIDAQYEKGTLAHSEALGEKFFELEWNQEAFDVFQNIVKEHPTHRQSLLRIAKIFLRGGRGTEALPPLYKVIESKTADADVYFDAGSALALTENWGAAREMYHRAIKANPQFSSAYYRRGKMLSMLGRDKEAEADMLTALRQDPENPIFAGGLAVYYERIGDPKRAREWYKKSLAMDPNQPFLKERLITLTEN